VGGEEEAAPALEGRIPVKIVGGRLVAQVELSSIHRRIPANLFIEFDTPCGLRLDNGAAGALKAENEAGETTPLSVHFPGFVITVESREHGPREDYAEFTRLYSREINEHALVGAIGAKILKNYRVTFDLHEGVIELELPDKDEDAETTGASVPTPPDPDDPDNPGQGPIEVSITNTDDIIWLPVKSPGGKIQAMTVATTRYDTLLDEEWCDQLGFPAGDIGSLKLDSLDLSKFVAFRPDEVIYVHPDGAIGVIGLNLLKHLRLTIDHQRKTASCQVTAPAVFPEADRGFFKAMVEEDADKLETWLDQFPTERLSQEAAHLLLGYRIDEAGEPEQFDKAIRWLAGTWREDIISTRGLDLMHELRAAGYPMQAVIAGELGVEGGRKDRYPNSVHKLHATMGDILLDHDEDKRAWRHLLSAAFGLPEDGLINLKLGQFYERQKRYNRALSRYVQAVITVDAGEQAMEGLQRVQKLNGETERLSVDTIAPLIEGKTYNYAAATRYRPKAGQDSNRVALVEFFTNTHIKHPSKEEGAIGGALGNEGVMTYFPRTKLAMLTYHLPHPRFQMDSLTNELAQHAANAYRAEPTVQIVNGSSKFSGYGHVQEAEKIYRSGRGIILASLSEGSKFDLALVSSLAGDEIAGQLTIKGPQKADARVQIVLAERGVLYPGKSKVVIQRMVARAALTSGLDGAPFAPKDGTMTLQFSRSLKAITEANIAYLENLQASGAGSVQPFAAKIDPRQLTVVAFVRDGSSNKILQAIQIDPSLPGENP
jgi:hypothetical protein